MTVLAVRLLVELLAQVCVAPSETPPIALSVVAPRETSEDDQGVLGHRGGGVAAAQPSDQLTDSDAPDPCCDLAAAVIALRSAPHGVKGVLHDLGDNIGVAASASQPGDQPGSVSVVEDPQGSQVTIDDPMEQLRVAQLGHMACCRVAVEATHVNNCRAAPLERFTDRAIRVGRTADAPCRD